MDKNLGVVKFAGYEAHAKPSCSLPFQILWPGFECGECGEESDPSSSQGFFTARRGGSTAGSYKPTGIPHRHIMVEYLSTGICCRREINKEKEVVKIVLLTWIGRDICLKLKQTYEELGGNPQFVPI